jgi:hypothetical protein
MTKEWFQNIPRKGILCKCRYNKDGDHYRIDVITRYNDHPLSEFRFRNNEKYYADAVPLTVDEVLNLTYIEDYDE